ncbi:SPOSA6832_03483 [Sporobolomyces salmonicolor]|uniref:SPOSA6832_03483-mRNA-1:cds n=1 Tax=Sporidiobolus salmonicolor TaxID=5005 RepID=A0A0D6EP90_SPOSA|nr:SPOSA6832_03483 [Sporobolomyces salmonicolor]
MSRRHPGSLVPKYLHDPAILKLMNSPLSDDMIECVANKTIDAVRCRPPPDAPPTPPHTPGNGPIDKLVHSSGLPPLPVFVESVVRKSKCHVPTLLCTLVFLERLKERLPQHARGCHTTRHRVFLAALIVTAKYLNDSSPQNKHWVRDAEHFSAAEVNLMERQFLDILNFDLRFDEAELTRAITPLLQPIRVHRSRPRSSNILTPTSVPDSEMNVVEQPGQDVRQEEDRSYRPYRQPTLASFAVETGSCGRRCTPAYVRTTAARPRLLLPVPGILDHSAGVSRARLPSNPNFPPIIQLIDFDALIDRFRAPNALHTMHLPARPSISPLLLPCRHGKLQAFSWPPLHLCHSSFAAFDRLPSDPVPWSLGAPALTAFLSGERLVKGELRLEPAHKRGGMFGLNLRAADQTEALFVMGLE